MFIKVNDNLDWKNIIEGFKMIWLKLKLWEVILEMEIKRMLGFGYEIN